MNNNIFNYTETMQEADEYKMGRRALLPAIYNEQRLNSECDQKNANATLGECENQPVAIPSTGCTCSESYYY